MYGVKNRVQADEDERTSEHPQWYSDAQFTLWRPLEKIDPILEASTDPLMIDAAAVISVDFNWPLDINLTVSAGRAMGGIGEGAKGSPLGRPSSGCGRVGKTGGRARRSAPRVFTANSAPSGETDSEHAVKGRRRAKGAQANSPTQSTSSIGWLAPAARAGHPTPELVGVGKRDARAKTDKTTGARELVLVEQPEVFERRHDNIVRYSEHFESFGDFVEFGLVVGFADVDGHNVFDLVPVQEEGEGGPTAQSGDDVRSGAADAETVAKSAKDAGSVPDLRAAFHEPGLGYGRPGVVESLESEKGRAGWDYRIDEDMVVEGLDRAKVVVAGGDREQASTFACGFGPGNRDGIGFAAVRRGDVL
ncbi:hypothetical protein DFH08DRAFT_1054755 [Mycena albidolilacea]|uniref:Uncharacterized protein n=1 Tax=Mycena albidolilacea TaxID=1033008 RepID=A0AAD6Z3D5_9AGAR|nr:hypothetical protein DFH08DRAFT_1054755 [Mycena albidolilacea]